MKYCKTVNLWAGNIQEQILTGKVSYLPGQWMRCGDSGKPCRYVGTNGRTINVVHWQGSNKATTELFNARIRAAQRGVAA